MATIAWQHLDSLLQPGERGGGAESGRAQREKCATIPSRGTLVSEGGTHVFAVPCHRALTVIPGTRSPCEALRHGQRGKCNALANCSKCAFTREPHSGPVWTRSFAARPLPNTRRRNQSQTTEAPLLTVLMLLLKILHIPTRVFSVLSHTRSQPS